MLHEIRDGFPFEAVKWSSGHAAPLSGMVVRTGLPRITPARHACPLTGSNFSLLQPLVQRVCRATDLGHNRHDRLPARRVFRLVIQHHPYARARTSGENLFVVLLVIAPSSQELGPPAKPGRFSCAPGAIAFWTIRH